MLSSGLHYNLLGVGGLRLAVDLCLGHWRAEERGMGGVCLEEH